MRDRLRLAGIVALAATFVTGCRGPSHDVNTGSAEEVDNGRIEFLWDTYRQFALGSDNWPLTWCEDDHQYTSWGDGGGFAGTNSDGRVSLGFARIEGNYPNFTAHNVWGGKDPGNPATFGGKVESMLCLNGTLYAWHSPGSGASGYDWKQLIRSRDKAVTWEDLPQSRIVGNAVARPGLPFFINYGQNYGANTDGFVYIYTIRIAEPENWEVQKPGITWLARAPVANEAFIDTLNWAWVVELDSTHTPTWGPRSARVPVLEDPDGVMRSSAVYVPAFHRYVMVTNHTARNRGNIAIWEAPAPWGPWILVLKEFGWPHEGDVAQQFAFGGFSPKWLADDGRCVFVWFRPDAWNSVGCRFNKDGR